MALDLLVELEVPSEEDEAEPETVLHGLADAVDEVEDALAEEEVALHEEDEEADSPPGDEAAADEDEEEHDPHPEAEAPDGTAAEGRHGEGRGKGGEDEEEAGPLDGRPGLELCAREVVVRGEVLDEERILVVLVGHRPTEKLRTELPGRQRTGTGRRPASLGRQRTRPGLRRGVHESGAGLRPQQGGCPAERGVGIPSIDLGAAAIAGSRHDAAIIGGGGHTFEGNVGLLGGGDRDRRHLRIDVDVNSESFHAGRSRWHVGRPGVAQELAAGVPPNLVPIGVDVRIGKLVDTDDGSVAVGSRVAGGDGRGERIPRSVAHDGRRSRCRDCRMMRSVQIYRAAMASILSLNG